MGALISPEEIRSFVAGYDAGLTIGQIGAALQAGGYPVRTYGSYIHMAVDQGLSRVGRLDSDRPWTDDDDALLRRLIAAGNSAGRVMSYLYRDVPTCTARAEALGLEMPTDLPAPTPPEAPPHILTLAAVQPWGQATKRGHWSEGAPA